MITNDTIEAAFKWYYPITDHVVAHNDGYVSLAMHWPGVDTDLMADTVKHSIWNTFIQFTTQLELSVQVENHLFRARDRRISDEYLAVNQKLTRAHDVCGHFRQEIAEHLGRFSFSNEVIRVFTFKPAIKWYQGERKKVDPEVQHRLAKQLEQIATTLSTDLPGVELLTTQAYCGYMLRSLNPFRHQLGEQAVLSDREPLSTQLVRPIGEPVDGMLEIDDGLYCKTLLLYLLPDAFPDWFSYISTVPAHLHVSHIIKPLNQKLLKTQLEAQKNIASPGAGTTPDGDDNMSKAESIRAFKQYLAGSRYGALSHAMYIQLYGTAEEVNTQTTHLRKFLNTDGKVVTESFIQHTGYRAAQPGLGYLSDFFRKDAADQVVHMMPVQTYHAPDDQPRHMLRLRNNNWSLMTYSYALGEVNHSFFAAMTRGGKDVLKAAEILETYGLGIDWMILEAGSSQKWVVEACGGNYTEVTKEIGIQIFPPYSVAAYNEDTGLYLDSEIKTGLRDALAYLVTDGEMALSVHGNTVMETALELLYCTPEKPGRPTIQDFKECLADPAVYFDEDTGRDHDAQKETATLFVSNLASLLKTNAGKILMRENNLELSDGICGIDLRKLLNTDKSLAVYLLLFCLMNMVAKAMSNRRPVRIVLNEVDEFRAHLGSKLDQLMVSIARMGGKENTSLDIMSQEFDTDKADESILNQMVHISYLYRKDSHDTIAKRFSMPEEALTRWKSFDYPVGKPFRPAIRRVGEHYFDLYLSFPQSLLDIVATSSSEDNGADLDLREHIGKMTDNPFERLTLFRQAKEGGLDAL